MPVPVIVRRARELLVAGTTLAIAAAAHLLAGGALPTSVAPWGLPVALTLPVAVWTARRRLTLRRLLPSMAVLQLVQHSALWLMAAGGAGTGSATAPAVGADTAHAGHLAMGPGSLAPPVAAVVGHGHHGHGSSSLMLFAHAVAVVLTAVLIATGDRAAAFLVVWLAAVALLVRTGARPVIGLRTLTPRTASWVPRTWLYRSGLRLRGPPRALAHV